MDDISTPPSAALSACRETRAPPPDAGTTTPRLSSLSGSWAWSCLGLAMITVSFLESFERRGKQPHDLAPSGHRGACVLAPHQRDAGALRNDDFGWDFQAPRFGTQFHLPRRAQDFVDDVVARKAEPKQRADGRVLVAPAPLSTARRECVAGHGVAILQSGLRLIVQRHFDVFDRIDEVQAGGERLQIGAFVDRRARRRRHHELRQIKQGSGMRGADGPRRTEAAMRAALQARCGGERLCASAAVAYDELIKFSVRYRSG